MTDAEKAVIEAAVAYHHHYHAPARIPISVIADFHKAVDELHNESDGKWGPSDD